MDPFPNIYRSFHPKDPPCTARNYDIGALSKEQKVNLNLRKIITRRENEIYLKMHPEVKGLISLLLRFILGEQPRIGIHEKIGEFFNRPYRQLLVDLFDYLLHGEHSFSAEDELQAFKNIQMDHRAISI